MFPTNHWPIAGTDPTALGDHATDYLLIPDLKTGNYEDTSGASTSGVKARRGTMTRTDFTAAAIGVSPRSVPWNVFNATLGSLELEVGGRLYMQSRWWKIVAITGEREDGTQTRCITTRERS